MGVATAIKILLQQSAQLRAEVSSGLRTGAARFVCVARQRAAESNISSSDQISRAVAARTGLETISERGSALTTNGHE